MESSSVVAWVRVRTPKGVKPGENSAPKNLQVSRSRAGIGINQPPYLPYKALYHPCSMYHMPQNDMKEKDNGLTMA